MLLHTRSHPIYFNIGRFSYEQPSTNMVNVPRQRKVHSLPQLYRSTNPMRRLDPCRCGPATSTCRRIIDHSDVPSAGHGSQSCNAARIIAPSATQLGLMLVDGAFLGAHAELDEGDAGRVPEDELDLGAEGAGATRPRQRSRASWAGESAGQQRDMPCPRLMSASAMD